MKCLSSTVAGNIVGSVSYTAGSYTLTGLIVGKNYYYTMGANDTSIAFASGATHLKSASATGVFTATDTTATLAGSGSSAVGTTISPIYGVPLFPTTVTPSLPTRLVTVGQFPAANPNFSRALQISDEYVFVKRGTAAVAFSLADMINLALTDETSLTWTPPVILTQPSNAACTATAAATQTLTNDGTNVTDGDTVTIGTKVYTLQSTLTNVDGNVKIGASNTATMTNLFHAINASGGTVGTDYATATTANTKVTATNPTGTTVVVTAITSGVAGNLIATTEASTHLAWGAATLAGGTVAATTMTVVGGSEYTMSYQWQYSADGSSWSNCTGTVNGCAYTNGTTSTLTMTPTTTGQTGYYHRCTITDNAGSFGLTNGSITSSNVTLTIP